MSLVVENNFKIQTSKD